MERAALGRLWRVPLQRCVDRPVDRREVLIVAVQVRIVAPVLLCLARRLGLKEVVVRQDQLLGHSQRLVAPEPVTLGALAGPGRAEDLVAQPANLPCALLPGPSDELGWIRALRISILPVPPIVVEVPSALPTYSSPPF